MRTPRGMWLAGLLGVLGAPGVSAQAVLVHVLAHESERPQVGAIVRLVHDGDEAAKTTLTDERGRALFVGIPFGTYALTVEMIGMATVETTPFDLHEGGTVTRTIRLESSAIELEGLEIELASGRCTVRPGREGAIVARAWDEARKALASASLTEEQGTYRFETLRYERTVDRDSRVVLSEERDRDTHYLTSPYESLPAQDLVENGFVQPDGRDDVFYAPDAAVMLSDVFLDTHCFYLHRGSDADGRIGLGFRPAGKDKSVPDIEGTMWLDAESAELQWLEYWYRYLEPERTSSEVGGRVEFEKMPDGRWIVSEWWIRMPEMASQSDLDGRRLVYIDHYRETGGLVVDVREAGGRVIGQRARTGGVEGVVRDSIGSPIRGASVGVVGSHQRVFTDREGRFSITGLPEGTYQVDVVVESLERAGLSLPAATRDVVVGEMSYLDVHIPSVGEMLFDDCREERREEARLGAPGAVLTGTVVDPGGRRVGDARVEVHWTRYDFRGVSRDRRPSDLQARAETRVVTTGSDGRFTFCQVPMDRTLRLSASTRSSESEPIDFVVPEHELAVVKVLRLGGG